MSERGDRPETRKPASERTSARVGRDAPARLSGREQHDGKLRKELARGPAALDRQLAKADARASRPSEARRVEGTERPSTRGDRTAGTEDRFRRAVGRAREAERGDHVWVDRGVVDTKVSRIDRKEYAGVWESQRTHKYPRESVDQSLRTLPEVQRRLRSGSKQEDFHALHRSKSAADRQLGRTYDTYYGSDPIAVSLSADGRSSVESGRHRLDSASRMGFDELPMRVREQIKRERGGR